MGKLKRSLGFIFSRGTSLEYLEHLESNPDIDRRETLGHFVNSNGYSELFQKAYLVMEELDRRGCQIKIGYAVNFVSTCDGGCTVTCLDGSSESYDAYIMGVHAPDALSMLGEQVMYEEKRILGAFQYSGIFLHRDKKLMPRNQAAWSAWNFLGNPVNIICLTYWLNVLQNIDETGQPFLVTLNPPHTPENTFLKWSTSHPVPSVAASKASLELDQIQGKRGICFCGAYQGIIFQIAPISHSTIYRFEGFNIITMLRTYNHLYWYEFRVWLRVFW